MRILLYSICNYFPLKNQNGGLKEPRFNANSFSCLIFMQVFLSRFSINDLGNLLLCYFFLEILG